MSYSETVERQRRAARPDSSVWVAASAGAGKTRVLVDRVLRLLLAGTPPGRILCLTFTKAAAAQMWQRVNDELGAWAATPDDEILAAEIRERLGLDPGPDTCTLARRLFSQALDVPGGMKIQTIHSFCESVLGRFPLEAGIAPHFEVMDERSAAEALRDARDAVLARARTEGDGVLSRALGTVTQWVGEDAFSDLMRGLMAERGRIQQMTGAGHDAFVARLRGRLGLALEETEAGILAAAVAEGAFDRDGLKGAVAALAQGSDADMARGDAITGWLAAHEAGRMAAFDAYQKIFLTGDGTVRKRLITKPAAATNPAATGTLEAEGQRLITIRERRNAAVVASATEALVRLAAALMESYEGHKSEHALLDYDDLILHVRRLLSGPGGASWVMYKLDGGIDHILIDEAQDTNPDQWQVVRSIAEEFFAGAGARDIPRTVFAVGDAKQSIFSFQRADPQGFADMQDYFARRAAEAGQDWDTVELDLSFRSTAPVLRAVDQVFAQPGAREGLGTEHVRHIASRHKQAGRVEMWPTVAPLDREEPPPWAPLDAGSAADAPAVRLARGIAGQIRRWLDTGEVLPSRGRALRAGDIMVLVRRRTVFVDYLVSALKNLEVPVAGVDRMVLTEQLPVMDLIALGRFLLLPEDDLNLATVLKGPLIGFDEETLFSAAYGRGGNSLWRTIRRRAPDNTEFAAAVEYLVPLLTAAGRQPPYELFAGILNGGRERIVERLGEQANDPIDEFLALALNYEHMHPPSLQGFLQWVAEGGTQIKRDLEQATRDEVRIMTVHGAKGLEAPVVILADTLQKPDRTPPILWTGSEDSPLALWAPRAEVLDPVTGLSRGEAAARRDEEYRRLLYVAMTRAEDRLYVCGHETGKAAPEGNWYQLIQAGLSSVARTEEMTLPAPGSSAWSGPGLVLDGPQTGPPDQPAGAAAALAEVTPLPHWARQARPPEEVPPRPLAPSRPEADDPPVLSPLADSGARFRRGLLVHRMLQALPGIAAPDRQSAALAFLAHPSHGLDDEARSQLWQEVRGVMEAPGAAPLFAPGSRAEVPIAGRLGDMVVSGRVDRLAVADGVVHVADYKTNRPPPRRVAEVTPVYLRQMAAYREILARIYPGHEIKCWLLWTVGARLMPLSAVELAPWAP